MKKFLFIIAATCVALACSKENIQNDATPENEQSAKGKISFVVDVESISDSKATISASDNFAWEDSDRAAVYTSEGTKVVLTPSGISGGVAIFTGDVPSGQTVAEGAIVVYPADFLTASNTVTFPAAYDDATETKGQGTVLAAKVASGRKLTFKYLAATLKATITDVPSVATSITVESTAVLTGAHDIIFSEGTPSLSTSSTAQKITFNSPSAGNNILVVPVPATGSSQTITYSVKYNESNLFTKNTTKTLNRNTYMSMADLTIAPSVYLVSDMTSWTDGEKVPMILSGTDASFTINAVAGKHWRPIVVYPTGFWVFYGFTGSDSSETSGTFNDITAVDSGKMSALVNASAGNYTLNFNYVTGAYSSTSTGTISGFQIGDASHGNLQNMTKLTSTLAYNVRQWGNGGGTLYAYYNNDYAASQGGDYFVSSENYYLWVYNFSTNTLTATWFDYNSAKSWGVVNLYGSFDSWMSIESGGGLPFTNITGTPAWFLDVDWDSETTFRFNGLSITSMPYDDASGYLSSYIPTVTKIENDGYGNTNFKVAAGKYTIIFYENQKWTILNRD